MGSCGWLRYATGAGGAEDKRVDKRDKRVELC